MAAIYNTIVVPYRRFRQMSGFLGREGHMQNLKQISQKLREHTHSHGKINSACHADQLYTHGIYFINSPKFPFGCCKHSGKLNIDCSGYSKKGPQYFQTSSVKSRKIASNV